MGMKEHQLFPTRVYSERLDRLTEARTALVSDVMNLVDPVGSSPLPTLTREDLEHRTEPHWRIFFAELDRIVDGIAASLHPTWVERSLHRRHAAPQSLGEHPPPLLRRRLRPV